MRREDKERAKRAKTVKSHYDVLGVERDADLATIRKAYLAQARRAHPDAAGGSDAAFQELQQAYAVLTDDALRQRYDSGAVDGPTDEEKLGFMAEHLINDFMSAVLQDEKLDPERMDVVLLMLGAVDRKVGDVDKSVRQIAGKRRKAAKIYKRMKPKHEGRNFAKEALLGQILSMCSQIDKIRFELRAIAMMRKMINANSYHFEPTSKIKRTNPYDEIVDGYMARVLRQSGLFADTP